MIDGRMPFEVLVRTRHEIALRERASRAVQRKDQR
jgi:hypothetical protein